MTSLTPSKLEEMNSSDMAKLKKNSNKDELCGYIQELRGKLEELQSYQLIAKRVQMLERSHLQSIQYSRRESIEIYGLPESVSDNDLEQTCINILDDIGCGKIKKSAIHACHRMRNKKNTIIRFVNRKNADLAIHNRNKLKNIDKAKHGLTDNIYVNESLCRPLQFLLFKVRTAFKAKKITSYNIWKGKLSLKIDEQQFFISHIDDLIDIGLADEDDRLSFFK